MKTVTETRIEYIKYPIPKTLLEPCPNVNIKVESNGDLLYSLIEINEEYKVCAEKIKSISAIVENINETTSQLED